MEPMKYVPSYPEMLLGRYKYAIHRIIADFVGF